MKDNASPGECPPQSSSPSGEEGNANAAAVPLEKSTEAATSSADGGHGAEQKKSPFRLKLAHLLLPYAVGLAWILLHPAVSVVTGELKCRGIFVDESALEPHQLSIGPYPVEREWSIPADDDGGVGWGLCSALRRASAPLSASSARRGGRRRVGGDREGAVECVSHPGFDAALVVPPSAPVRPVESLAIIVPAPPKNDASGWVRSDFHVSVLNLIDRLSDPAKASWLAKNVLVVSPREANNGTAAGAEGGQLDESSVEDFLDAYLGTSTAMSRDVGSALLPPSLPPRYSSSMLRAVLVLEASPYNGGGGDNGNGGGGSISLLPQGRRGVLPNLDLFFASANVYRYLRFLNGGGRGGGNGGSKFRAHPYHREHLQAEAFVDENVASQRGRQYGADLAGMALFALAMARGPYPPHAPSLQRGVDALTVRVVLPAPRSRSSGGSGNIDHAAAEFLQRTEQLLRALSNTHERLHHSVTQYLLPSPYKFVSNGEYTYPTVLLVLPLVLRAATVVLVDIERFGFGVGVGAAVMGAITAGTVGWLAFASVLGAAKEGFVSRMSAILVLLYALSAVIMFRLVAAGSAFCKRKTEEEDRDAASRRTSRQSIQFVACLTAVYLHVPLLLSHVSLAAPSLLFWTPLLAFPKYDGGARGVLRRIMHLLLSIATFPPVAYVVSPALLRGFGYTPYVWGVYVPLHLLATAMMLL